MPSAEPVAQTFSILPFALGVLLLLVLAILFVPSVFLSPHSPPPGLRPGSVISRAPASRLPDLQQKRSVLLDGPWYACVITEVESVILISADQVRFNSNGRAERLVAASVRGCWQGPEQLGWGQRDGGRWTLDTLRYVDTGERYYEARIDADSGGESLYTCGGAFIFVNDSILRSGPCFTGRGGVWWYTYGRKRFSVTRQQQ